MKKLTVFLTLLLCVCFTKMSAQSAEQIITWAVSGETHLEIYKSNIKVVDVTSTGTLQTGAFTYTAEDEIEIYANTTGSNNNPLLPVICEDNYIGSGSNGFFYEPATHDEYNFLNEEHTQLYESFSGCGNDIYIEIKSY
ncbi:DUF2147 domain-containing protein [Flavobacterium undicola]|uniref:hypothetical protein n=1 Tax=Flavobacterium undicola TaxID=1932779 RepID=UPI001376FF7B|nr:hypothetical protein [Flavobacterium undicola]MBA0883580.1 hypothetical protein [Flavobacterium undicola]